MWEFLIKESKKNLNVFKYDNVTTSQIGDINL